MDKIHIEINPVTNYIFHMLSVAGVGYDNEYGRKWRHTVAENDRAMLKSHESQLTVKGGEHCGEWYDPLVCRPARGDIAPEEYYARVEDPAMAEICRVMGAYYQPYLQHVYPETLRALQPYAQELQRLVDESNLASRAEALLGAALDRFRVMLVNSVAWGAEAIDISPDQDVFGIDRTPREEMLFIGHEYIIYLLKQVLEGTAAFCTWDTWRLTEGLAEYYLLQMFEDIGFFHEMKDEVDMYRRQEAGLAPREKFLRASARRLVEVIAREYHALLGNNLRGVYVHGSMAFGCFRWDKGDVDFLVVVENEPTDEQKKHMLELLLQLDAFAPAKGFEMSVVLAKDCAAPVHPLPFCLHFSNAHKEACRTDMSGYISRMQGCDPDLAAHFTVTRAVGQAVWGKPVMETFGEVPWAAYADSILSDVENAAQDMAENPVYVTLNLCRVLAALREGAVLSKEQGGAWALEKLPQDMHAMVRCALEAYMGKTKEPMGDAAWAARMLAMIKEEMECR